MTNEELNRFMAVEVMGWEVTKRHGISFYVAFPNKDLLECACQSFQPSTSIADAMRVVEKIRILISGDGTVGKILMFSHGPLWTVRINTWHEAEHDDIKIAICLAAKAWVEAQKQQREVSE